MMANVPPKTMMRKTMATIVLCTVLGLGGCYEDSRSLESTAKAFVQQLGSEPVGASCMNMDSDNDSYVSCTVSIKGAALPLAVECASRWKIVTSGCKLQRGQQLQR